MLTGARMQSHRSQSARAYFATLLLFMAFSAPTVISAPLSFVPQRVVQPDGSVLPCQSYFKPLGNALTDEFPDMWDADLAKQLRAHSFAPERCRSCIQFPMCGGGCPLDQACGF